MNDRTVQQIKFSSRELINILQICFVYSISKWSFLVVFFALLNVSFTKQQHFLINEILNLQATCVSRKEVSQQANLSDLI